MKLFILIDLTKKQLYEHEEINWVKRYHPNFSLIDVDAESDSSTVDMVVKAIDSADHIYVVIKSSGQEPKAALKIFRALLKRKEVDIFSTGLLHDMMHKLKLPFKGRWHINENWKEKLSATSQQ